MVVVPITIQKHDSQENQRLLSKPKSQHTWDQEASVSIWIQRQAKARETAQDNQARVQMKQEVVTSLFHSGLQLGWDSTGRFGGGVITHCMFYCSSPKTYSEAVKNIEVLSSSVYYIQIWSLNLSTFRQRVKIPEFRAYHSVIISITFLIYKVGQVQNFHQRILRLRS